MFNHQELINTMGLNGHKKFLKEFMKDIPGSIKLLKKEYTKISTSLKGEDSINRVKINVSIYNLEKMLDDCNYGLSIKE